MSDLNNDTQSSINKGADFYELHSRSKLNYVLPFHAGVGLQLKYAKNLNTRREMDMLTLNDIFQAEVCSGYSEFPTAIRQPILGIHKTAILIFDGTLLTKRRDVPFICAVSLSTVRLQNSFIGGFPLNVTL